MATLKPITLCGFLLAALLSASQAAAQDSYSDDNDHGHAMAAEEDYEHAAPRQQSMLMWTFNALGWRYTLALPLAGLVCFVLALLIVVRGGSYAGPALLFVVPIPALIGLLGVVDGIVMVTTVFAGSSVAPKPNEVLEGLGTSVVTLLVGLLVMAPAYLVATMGLFIRTLMGDKTPPQKT